ncbi:sensor histidine kinase [Mesoterricola silvestris]|uniref:sensor histidine kinase n=1 Tax=Mesoterricola silvestris TaxID=2927979 RepID=UPI00292E39AE|nr:histidine kinase [Mesoterricola silvestris]
MHWNPGIRPFPGGFLRWVSRAILLGGLPSALAQALLTGPSPTYMAISFGVGAVCAVVLWGSYELLSPWIQAHPPDLDPGWAAILSLCKWMLVYAVLVAILLVTSYRVLHLPLSAFFVVVMGLLLSSLVVSVRSTTAQVALARTLEQSRARANLVALKSQLSPHTLFNALNAAASLVSKSPRDAERAIEHLSLLLRRILEALERETWTLGEEVDLIRHLLELEKIRFGARLSFSLGLPEACREQPIPPLLLLPLVENSLKHGFRRKVGPCSLHLAVEPTLIRLVDDGVGRQPGAPEGIGLRTVRQRLEAIGGRLQWPEVDSGCTVELSLCP